MACRPAGMSDDESGEEDAYFSVSHNNSNNHSNNRWSAQSDATGVSHSTVDEPATPQEQTRQEEQELQFRVLSACMSGNLKVIDEYVKGGHDVNGYLHTGWTLLLYGASSVLPEVVDLLIKLEANPNKSKDGYTPLMVLCESTKGSKEQCLKCLSILIEAKANPNAHNKFMKTPLMFACKSREADVVEELLKFVKNVDATDTDGRTALHYAAGANKPEIVKLLLKNNATSTIADRSNLTASDIAETKGYRSIVALLELDADGALDPFCEVSDRRVWSDMFSDDIGETINSDVAEILFGMGLESYKSCFKGMSLKSFLKLTDDDLAELGMDVALHRKQFLDNLHKFHAKAWTIQSIGTIKRFLPYTLYDGVALLGNAARQIGVIGSSFQYLKNGLRKAGLGNDGLTDVQRAKYNEELKKTEQTLLLLKKDLRQILSMAKKVEKDNRGVVPASYIGPKERKHNWTIIVSVMLMTGMYLSKTSFVQRLWSN